MEASDLGARSVGVPLPVTIGVICSSDCLIRGSHHFRFGDGLGWPASNRKYRDAAPSAHLDGVVAFVVLSRSHPCQLDETCCSGREADRLAHRNGVCVEQIVPNAVALLLAKCRAHALGRSDASLLMQSPCRSSPRTSSSPSGGVDASMATGRKCRGRISMASAQRVGFSAPWRVRRWWWDRRPWGEGADQPRKRVG